ncbi:hypothetical protein RJ035_004242, partial [Blastomyces gilchristii]
MVTPMILDAQVSVLEPAASALGIGLMLQGSQFGQWLTCPRRLVPDITIAELALATSLVGLHLTAFCSWAE